MQALVKYGLEDGNVELRDAPEPQMDPRQVLLAVKAVGVCGSDLDMWHNTQSWRIKLPVILGHEFSGVIAQVGSEVKSWQVGDRVACETAAIVDGTCVYCLSGQYNLCPNRKGYGNQTDGAFTRYVVARPHILHRLPENVSFEQGALTEPNAVVYNALVEKSFIKPGETVVIQGAGAIGILAVQMARIRGAGTIILAGTERSKRRLEIGAELGARYTVNIEREDPVALVKSLGDGFGADVVVDCTGSSAALEQSLEMVRPAGRIVKPGWGREAMDFSLDPLVGKAVTLQGSFSHTYPTWEHVLALLRTHQINLDPVIGGIYPLPDWKQAFMDMERGANVKSVVVM